MKRCLFTIMTLCGLSQLWAQRPGYRQGLWLEFAGATPVYALSYERWLGTANAVEWYGQVGGSWLPRQVALPMSVLAVAGRGNHRLVLIGAMSVQVQNLNVAGGSDTFLLLSVGGGYRFQSRRTPWRLSVRFQPVLVSDPRPGRLVDPNPRLRWRLGLGLGYAF